MTDDFVRPSGIITIKADASIKAAAEMMHKNGVGCLIITDDGGAYAGLITERDIVSKVVAERRDSETTPLADVMTKQFITVSADTPPETVRRIMTANRIRHIPIIENGVIVGMHSIRDVVALQLLQDRMAAEEIARLSTCLKSIDINELTDVVTTEVPRLFGAQRCVLYFRTGSGSSDTPAIYEQKNCPCPPQCLSDADSIRRVAAGRSFCFENLPPDCRKRCTDDRRLAIWLEVSDDEQSEGPAGKLAGCLCMCGLASSIASNYDQIAYKANLCREVLNTHLTNARLYQQAKLTSLTDTLTGVGSRRFLEDRLQTESERAIRYDRPLSVAIMDIDNFKSINDLMGHGIGDETLRKLAACIRTEKRATDILARYGGDEFVLLMPETGAVEAVNLIERLREKVTHIKISDGASATISCGIAESSPDMEGSTGEIVRRADRALYDAKGAGRNCVRIWSNASGAGADENEVELEKIKRLQRRIAGLSEKSEKMFIQSIWGLVQALEAKDAYTRRHSENVMRYSVAIAETMAIGPKQIEMLRHAAMIHDIGKIGIPDAILDKPGKLTDAERLIIEQHPVIAVQILDKMSFLDREIAIIRHHHEKWNGEGYPDRLAGEQIPIGARIIAVADTFDALTSNRSYHESRPVAEALDILKDLAGKDFDPDVVNAMVSWAENVSRLHGPLDRLTLEHLLQAAENPDTPLESVQFAPDSA